jgi:hypothetical protein
MTTESITPSALDRLTQELQVWRKTTSTKPPKDPNAQALFELNTAWAETKAAHEARIAEQRTTYLAERERLLGLIQAAKPTTPRPQRSPGRPPRAEYSDAVKAAAYRAFVATGRSRVRAAMALVNKKDAELFERTLAEGKALAELHPIQSDFELRA